MLEKLCQADKCVSQIDLRKRRAKQALITDDLRMYKQCAFRSSTVLGCFLASWSSTYMKKVNDVTDWLPQTTDISNYFVWYPGLWAKESRLYLESHITLKAAKTHISPRVKKPYHLYHTPTWPISVLGPKSHITWPSYWIKCKAFHTAMLYVQYFCLFALLTRLGE